MSWTMSYLSISTLQPSIRKKSTSYWNHLLIMVVELVEAGTQKAVQTPLFPYRTAAKIFRQRKTSDEQQLPSCTALLGPTRPHLTIENPRLLRIVALKAPQTSNSLQKRGKPQRNLVGRIMTIRTHARTVITTSLRMRMRQQPQITQEWSRRGTSKWIKSSKIPSQSALSPKTHRNRQTRQRVGVGRRSRWR